MGRPIHCLFAYLSGFGNSPLLLPGQRIHGIRPGSSLFAPELINRFWITPGRSWVSHSMPLIFTPLMQGPKSEQFQGRLKAFTQRIALWKFNYHWNRSFFPEIISMNCILKIVWRKGIQQVRGNPKKFGFAGNAA